MENSNYDRTLKKEIMFEAYFGLIADFLNYFKSHNIDPEDEKEKNTPMLILFNKTKETLHNLMGMQTIEEVQEAIGQFKLIDKLLQQLRGQIWMKL